MQKTLVRTAFVAALAAACAAPQLAAAGEGTKLKRLYSTFGDAADRYLTSANIIAGKQSEWGYAYFQGMAFTLDEDAVLRKIQLGLSHNSGRNELVVVLRDDVDGKPGSVIRKSIVSDLDEFPHCCEVTQASLKEGVSLKAGVRYWLIMEARGDAYGGWNVNSIDATGTFVVGSPDSGWSPVDNWTLPAVRLLGD